MPSYSRALERMGWRGLFRGWVPMAMVSIPSNVVYLTVIEKTREQVFTNSYVLVNYFLRSLCYLLRVYVYGVNNTILSILCSL